MEDVQYLQQHAQVEEYIAFIDSAKRDKSAYRTPSEYQVVWNTPFTNVFGIDVLQMALPKSAYIINESNNKVYFRFHEPGYEDALGYVPPSWIAASISPGNHTVSSLMKELTDSLTARASDGRAQRIDVRPASTPFELTNRFVFMSDDPFEFDLDRSTIAPVVGFSQLLDVTSSQQIARFDGTQPLDDGLSTTIFSGATQSSQGFPLTRGVFMRQLFTSTLSGTLAGLKVMVSPFGDVSRLDATVNYSIINARTGRTVVWGELEVKYPELSEFSSMHVASDMKDTFLLTESYWLEIRDDSNLDPNNCYKVSYGTPASPSGTKQGTLCSVVGVVNYWYESGEVLEATVMVLPYNYLLFPPGIVNLTGAASYVQLRCPEIEKHMYRNRAFEQWNLGLAAAVITKDPDYVATQQPAVLPQRRFHPISKLSRLTPQMGKPQRHPP